MGNPLRLGRVRKTLILVGGVFFFALILWLSLALVYCIPASLMQDNLWDSQRILLDEGSDAPLRVTGGHFDNFTEYIMLSEAAQSGSNPLVASLETAYYADSDLDYALEQSIKGNQNRAYPRYWHGYLLYLKPLLCFFDIRDIRAIFQMLFFLLLVAATLSIFRAFGHSGCGIAIAMGVSLGAVGAPEAVTTLPIAPAFLLSLCGVIAVCRMSDQTLRERAYFVLLGFALLGALTAFFDFLDNPLYSLSFPLVILVLRLSKQVEIREMMKMFLLAILFWCFGYIGLWIMKWILATFVTGANIFGDAAEQIAFRTGASGEGASYGSALDALLGNISALGIAKWVLFASCLGALACSAVQIVRSKRDGKGSYEGNLIVILLLGAIAFLPVAWYFLLSNHSIIHAGHIAFRNFGISIFALLVIMTVCGQKKRMGD